MAADSTFPGVNAEKAQYSLAQETASRNPCHFSLMAVRALQLGFRSVPFVRWPHLCWTPTLAG